VAVQSSYGARVVPGTNRGNLVKELVIVGARLVLITGSVLEDPNRDER
jgi:hypothetical protein